MAASTATDNRSALTRPWCVIILLSSFFVFALKACSAYFTSGTADILLWLDFLARIRECGTCVYETGGVMTYMGGQRVNPFNHPPFMIHYLLTLGFISDATGLPFRFIFRLITSTVDLANLAVVYQLLKRTDSIKHSRYLGFVFAPATIIVSGYHGNTDTIVIFFVLLSALVLTTNRVWLAGIIFGMALNVKIIPVIFAPCIFFYLPNFKKRMEFFACAGLMFTIASFPYIAQSPVLIAREVLGYRGFSGRWGWTRALYALTQGEGIYKPVVTVGTYLLFLFITYRSYIMNWNRQSPLFLQLGAIAFIFLSFTTGWGTNYMAWLDPFVVLVTGPLGLFYYLSSGAMMAYLYFMNEDETTWLLPVSWMAVLVLTLNYLKRTSTKRTIG